MNNNSWGVNIEIQGTVEQVKQFVETFHESLPPLANVDAFRVETIPVAPETEFFIVDSVTIAGHSTPISPEVSICDDCLREMYDPLNRRYRYPFINCTCCGPRFTIIEDVPYDRPSTTMKSFPMCDRCMREYRDPADRRFHAQPNACQECGPKIWFLKNGQGLEQTSETEFGDAPFGESALSAFKDAIRAGEIVAVKGIGGFHLACDATNGDAIEKLRERKGRISKPFAVMVRDIDTCRLFSTVSLEEQTLLESKQRPIVLLRKNSNTNARVSGALPRSSLTQAIPDLDLIAPGNQYVGVMLPYSPLHFLLLESGLPLVMTSGNLTDEPIVRENVEAQERLANIADSFLLHNRPIYVVCDDSVVCCVEEGLLPIRRSRGYAPMPVRLTDSGASVLAVGGEIKATFCAAKNDYAYMSQHIGDMGNLETLNAMRRSIDHFLRLFRIAPEVVAADLHPGYMSTQWARDFSNSIGVPFVQVQHHHAHIGSLIAEHGLSPNQPIIGCCFDGTGYGTDGAIWGGEFMIADGGSFKRFAHLKYVPLPGGDASVRRPFRVALAHLFAAGLDWETPLPCFQNCNVSEKKLLRQQLEKNIHCVSTSSMGRLFDAVASLIGIRHVVSYEAQAAMEMEAVAATTIPEPIPLSMVYPFGILRSGSLEINSAPLIREICRDIEQGTSQAFMAAKFHHSVAQLVSEICVMARQESSINQVGLSGGVFQNVLLLSLTKASLIQQGFKVFCHQKVPPNDGGIALGQALIARHMIVDKSI